MNIQNDFQIRITIINYEDTLISYTPENGLYSERTQAIEGGATAFRCTPRAVRVEVLQTGHPRPIAVFNSRHLNYSAHVGTKTHETWENQWAF